MDDKIPRLSPSQLSDLIWRARYRLDESEVDRDASFWRVARALAAGESRPQEWAQRFFDIMQDLRFLPAGRILAGAGANRAVTLFNCFVMGSIPDDMAGIFDHLKEAALTLQQGGGIGYDFSTLRPKGAWVETTGGDSSGPLPFMDVWDAMARTIMAAGHRRGAMMACLRDDHPDILDFVSAKRDPHRLRLFNLSVLISDDLLKAVDEDAAWPLRFAGQIHGSISAPVLWDAIMDNAFAMAEPGVLFIDRINRENNLHYCETIHATNPCGEQPLPPYGACLLGSFNLATFVREPFGPRARLDMQDLLACVPVAVRMLDNAIDASRFPLAAQAHEARAKRRIGLGVTGLADALIMLGLRYDASEGRQAAQDWMQAIQNAAYAASVALAREKGAFPLFQREAFMDAPMIDRLDARVREGIARYGLRNSHLTSIAPAGTISLLAGNVSSGIEPVFDWRPVRRILLGSEAAQYELCDYAAHLRDPDGPPFLSAMDIAPADHVRMQATLQPWVDGAISKTINMPEETKFDDFRAIYRLAYDLGTKGCTAFRPNPVTGSVLSEKKEREASPLNQGLMALYDSDECGFAACERPD